MKGLLIKSKDGTRHIRATRYEDGTTQFRFANLISRKDRDIFRADIRLSDSGIEAMNILHDKLKEQDDAR